MSRDVYFRSLRLTSREKSLEPSGSAISVGDSAGSRHRRGRRPLRFYWSTTVGWNTLTFASMHLLDVPESSASSSSRTRKSKRTRRDILHSSDLLGVEFANISGSANASTVVWIARLRETGWRIFQSIDVLDRIDWDVACTAASVWDSLSRHDN